jgi:putative transcriptional regulator
VRIERQLTDAAVLHELGQRLTRHRLDRNLSQEHLATEAGVGRRTVQRLEAGESVQLTSLVRVLRAAGLVEGLEALVPAPVASPMEQLRRTEGRRRRAGRASGDRDDAAPWSWGDDDDNGDDTAEAVGR